MAPIFALISALLVSQVSLASGAKMPAEQALACQTNDGGCTCAAIGAIDNTSAVDCEGPKADLDNCRKTCCGSPPVPSCYSAMVKSPAVCSGLAEWDFSKFSMPAGAPASEQDKAECQLSAKCKAASEQDKATMINCCRVKPIIKCSEVMCASQGAVAGQSNPWAGAYVNKAGSADKVCTSLEDCEMKCCVKNPLMCGGVSTTDIYLGGWCGANLSTSPVYLPTSPVAPTCVGVVATAAMLATFTVSADNASFRSACCTANPTKTACAADFACPELWQRKDPMPKVLYYTHTKEVCCVKKASVKFCGDLCTLTSNCQTRLMCQDRSPPYAFPDANSCLPATQKKGCASAKCGTGQVLDVYKEYDNATTGTVAAKCCFDKPAAAKPAKPIVMAKCSAYFAAAAAGAIKAEEAASGARSQGASSLPILAVAVLMLMKF